MNSSTICNIFQKDIYTKKLFKGQINIDTKILEITSTPAMFLLNTDKTAGPGEHWCIIIIYNREYTEFFDSFGINPNQYGISKEIFKYSKNIAFNEYPVQCPTSPTCGHHCIFWALNRARDLSLTKIMHKYKANCRTNDRMVFNFVKKRFGHKTAKFKL